VAIADKDKKLATLKELMGTFIASKDFIGLAAIVKLMVEENSTIVSRPLLADFVTAVKGIKDDKDFQKKLAEKSIDFMQPQAAVFEEQISNLRYVLAKLLVKEEEYIKAATILQDIPLEGGRIYPIPFKVKVYVKIAQLYLQEEKSLEAEKFLNKAAQIVNKKGVKPKDRLRYQSSFVQIRDFNRKFSEAASGYYRLAQLVYSEEERIDALGSGVRCAVLAPAGPQRSRLLALYYKDERSKKLNNYAVLEKMFLGRILRTEEVKHFEASLDEHQLAKNSDGVSILEQAIREHNLVAASKVYNNISFEQLGVLLGVSTEEAEKLASTMITQDRLGGTIDQMKQLLFFKAENANTIEDWDAHIEHVCSSVNGLIDHITAKNPQWIAANVK
jgi:COP9 signalosome complex subunit 4